MDSGIAPAISSANTIGEKLKKARESKSLTIDQVQKQTHIHSTVILALEEGRCDDILTTTYVKSFLKKYADHLGLDSRQIMKDYASLHPSAGSVNIKIRSENKESIGTSKVNKLIKPALLIIAALLMIVIAGKVIVAQVKKFNSDRRVKAIAKTSEQPKRKAIDNVARGRSSGRIRKEAPNSAITKFAIPQDVKLSVTLHVRQNVLIELRKDGELLFKTVMQKGTSESFAAESSFNIFIAKAEAVDVMINGRSVGPLGKGIISNMEITRKGIKLR